MTETQTTVPDGLVLSRDQAQERITDLGAYTCFIRVIRGDDAGRWFLRQGEGVTDDIGHAFAYRVDHAARIMGPDNELLIPGLENEQLGVHPTNPPPVAYPAEHHLTAWDAKNRATEFVGRPCLVTEGEGEYMQYYDEGADYAAGRDSAFVFPSVSAAIADIEHYNGEITSSDSLPFTRLIILPPVNPPAPLKPGARCAITQALTPSVLELVKAAPLNEVVRTQVHAQILVPLPPEAKTYDEIKDWIEANIIPPFNRGRVMSQASPAALGRVMTTTPQTGIAVRVSVSEVERGHCQYEVNNTGRRDYRLSADDILEELNSCDNDWDTLVENIDSRLREMASDTPPDLEQDDNGYDYDNHNATDYSDREINVSDFVASLESWLLANYPTRFNQIEGRPGF